MARPPSVIGPSQAIQVADPTVQRALNAVHARVADLESRSNEVSGSIASAVGDSGSGRYLGRQTFTAANGTYTPTAGASTMVWTLGAGGGGGGGAGGGAGRAVGGGGASGAVAYLPPLPAVTCAVTVGAGAPGGLNSGGNGFIGVDTTLTVQGGATYKAKGGAGGQGMLNQSGFNPAQGGAPVQTSSTLPTGAAWGQSPGGMGLVFITTTGGSMPGVGGSSPLGGAGVAGTGTADGNAATGNCAGGSGGYATPSVGQAGGAGAPGIAWVDEYA